MGENVLTNENISSSIIEVARLIKRELAKISSSIGYTNTILHKHKREEFMKKYRLLAKNMKTLSSAVFFDQKHVRILISPVKVFTREEKILIENNRLKYIVDDPYTKFFYKIILSSVPEKLLRDLMRSQEIVYNVESVYVLVPVEDMFVSIKYFVPRNEIASISLVTPDGLFALHEIAVDGLYDDEYAEIFSSEEELLTRNNIKKEAFLFTLRTIYSLLLKEKPNINNLLYLSRKLAGLLETL